MAWRMRRRVAGGRGCSARGASINAWTGDAAASGSVASSAKGWALGRVTKPPRVCRRSVPKRTPTLATGGTTTSGGVWFSWTVTTLRMSSEPPARMLRNRSGVRSLRAATRRYFASARTTRTASRCCATTGPGRTSTSAARRRERERAGCPSTCSSTGPRKRSHGRSSTFERPGAVGRLDLEGEALDRYVTALINHWQDAGLRASQAVVWAVDHGPGDISHLMRNVISPLQSTPT